ncbi:SGNH/GDSL hydrolase family protein [uncultured Schumannella sp.]|uniref:SGNH/GDSL hydrolase family protein n=1 Tax=uncultured Schumannella sp. TaxID=1195956 RepID=UPI0025D54A64|nr:SGNH/GDSL hydrolase family protein [uncultured Schumannella sp.]
MTHPFSSFVAIGDSFTEGVGDELPDGRVRGWADLVALGLAHATEKPVGYANLAIRGRLLEPIVTEQLDAAIALAPSLMSINGGGNDMLRPQFTIDSVATRLLAAVDRARAAGIHVLLLSGGNPSRHLPLGRGIERRGNEYADAVIAHLPREGVTMVDNWHDEELTRLEYWSVDKLHLNPLGHARVASNVLGALGVAVPEFGLDSGAPSTRPSNAAYWRDYVLPWIGRRLRGTSSGDSRKPKSATLQTVTF